ncbi:MAG: tRNA lysidine(34) synthetase TilS [Nitrospirota bacterium]
MTLLKDFIGKVTSTIKKYSMFSEGHKILIGLSGGPDSVSLLHVLKEIGKELNLELHALYVDHGLRPEEIGKEITFCKGLCENLNIPFVTKSINVKTFAREERIGRQEAARELRYGTLEETASEINAHRIALGHTADDQAETMLMRLVRGSGPTGFSGIPPVRGKIIRPLIEVERDEIERFLGARNINFIIDSSNLKGDYLRNKMRLSILPMLKELNPNLVETLSKTASIFREEERYFEIIVAKTLMKLISKKADNQIELFLAPFEIMDRVMMRRVLRRAIEETKDLRGIGFIHVEDIIELIKKGKPGDRLYLPKKIRVIKDYATLILTSEPPLKLNTCTLEVPGEIILKEAGISVRSYVVKNRESQVLPDDSRQRSDLAIFDADKLIFPLTIRSRRKGDFFYPSGLGKRKKLQDFFVDEKIPRDKRDKIPLVISEEDIVWIAGYRRDERFKVTSETKRILKLEVEKKPS